MKKCTASILVALCAILLMSCLLPGDSGKPQPPQKTIKANTVFLGEWTRSDNGMTVDIRETVVLMDNRTFEYSSSSSTALAFSGNTITKTPQEGVLLLNNTIRLYKMIQPEIPVECTETLTVSSYTPLTGIILYPNGDHTWFSNSWSESVPVPAFLQYEIHLFNSAASDPVDYVMTVKGHDAESVSGTVNGSFAAVTLTLSSLEKRAEYTVIHHWEKKTPYSYDTETEKRIGTVGAMTQVQPIIRAGFTADPVYQEKISEYGTTEIHIFYKRNYVTITWGKSGGSWDFSDDYCRSGYYDTEVTYIPPVPTRWGYSGSWETIPAVYPPEDLNIAVRWVPIPYTITVNLNGGTLPPGAVIPETYTIESPAVTLPVPVRENFLFEGWEHYPDNCIPTGTIGDIALQARWSAAQYPITYHLNGGSNWQNPASYTAGTAVSLKNPIRNGYRFLGWFETADCSGTPVSAIPADSQGSKTFYAKWECETYIIRYNLNGGSNNPANPLSYTIESGTLQLLSPSREGYTFDGWYTHYSLEGTPVTTLAAGSIGDKLFYAKWKPAAYTISYFINGVSWSEPTSYTLADSVTLPSVSLTGYTFDGWYDNPSFTGAIYQSVPGGSTGDKSFYGRKIPVTYTISYILDGGVNNRANPSTYTIESDEIVLMPPERAGYHFHSWLPRGIIRHGSTGNCTMTARWTPKNYGIIYNLNGGVNNSANPATYTIEQAVKLQNPEKPGYTFTGWTQDGNTVDGTIAKGSMGDRTFTATWQPMTYRISYYLNGGTNAEGNPTSYTYGTETVLRNPSRTGYQFAGWYADSSLRGQPVTTVGMNASDTALYARWAPIDYAITYNLNGGINNSANPASYTIEQAVKLQNPARNGYKFLSWNPSDSISRGSVGEREFTATWQPVTYTITYKTNGGSVSYSAAKSYTIESDEIILQEPTRLGYNFAGWYEDSTLTGEKITAIATGSWGNKTLYAKWTPVVYTITYNLNGGVNNSANPDTYTIESDDIVLQDPERPGYDFSSWNGSKTITSGSTGNKTFTAYWTAARYPVVYKLNGGVNNHYNNDYYTYASNNRVYDPQNRPGYSFKGWYLTADFSGDKITSIPNDAMGTVTVYAKWEAISYNVIYRLDGGTNHPDNPATYSADAGTVTLKEPTKQGCRFAGWYSDSNFTTPSDTLVPGITGTQYFYARWESCSAIHAIINQTYSDIEGITVSETESYFNFSVSGSYTQYIWYLDGVEQSKTSYNRGYSVYKYNNQITTGTHTIMIRTTDASGNKYSALYELVITE